MTARGWLVAILIAASMAATACGAAGNKAGYTTMSVKDLQAEMAAGKALVIVDLREPELYRAGHIPSSKNIPFDDFEGRAKELGPQSNIVLVCHTGPMGDAAGAFLAERGYAHVRNLDGGMAAWNGRLEK